MKPFLRTCALGVYLLFGIPALAQPAPLVTQEQLLGYLDSLTQWQREMAAVSPHATNARELVFRDSLQENAAHVLQSGFVFLRSMASAEAAAGENDPESVRERMTKQADALKERIGSLRAQLTRAGSAAVRTSLQEQIRLEQARLELAATILANLNAASNKSPNKLLYTIDSLSRSIPELQSPSARTTRKPAEPAEKEARSANSVFTLGSDIFDVTRKQRELDAMLANTSSLKKHSMELMKQLRSGLGEPAEPEEAEAEKPAEQPKLSVDEQVQAYKQIGANIVPLAEAMRWMDTSKQTLNEWRQVLHQQRDTLLRQFGMNLAVLFVTLAVPLALSEITRRTIAHTPDGKRKRQLNTARRILTGIAVLFILLLNFISDFSSFATFAGFLTAGLAVALQSVLLSLVAHFLFYGRYGIRKGDRIHVAGVTGDIVQIGMVRFYLRELQETESGLEPTGKTVAFPNSIVFQNLAFYKYA